MILLIPLLFGIVSLEFVTSSYLQFETVLSQFHVIIFLERRTTLWQIVKLIFVICFIIFWVFARSNFNFVISVTLLFDLKARCFMSPSITDAAIGLAVAVASEIVRGALES